MGEKIRSRRLVWALAPYALIVLAFAADRLSKSWAVGHLTTNGPVEVNSLLSLRPTYNQGIAFGLLQGIGPAIGWLSILIVAGLLVYLIRLPHTQSLMRLGLPLVIGGAAGNLVDRIVIGEVLDFIQTPLRPGIFNVADVMINLGVVLSIVGAFWQGRDEPATAPTGEVELEERAAS